MRVVEFSSHFSSTKKKVICPFSWPTLCYTVAEQEEAVILNWGQLQGTATTPGVHFANPCGRQLVKISKRQIAHELRHLKVIDRAGTPLLISGVITYFWDNSVRAALECDNPSAFVEVQASAVLKSIISRYPYESLDGSPCIKSGAQRISDDLVELLQARVTASGARILGLRLNEVRLAPEISNQFLRRQAAYALIEAREKIVEGAVACSVDAINQLNERGHGLSDMDKGKIVSNLLAVLVSDQDVVPTLSME